MQDLTALQNVMLPMEVVNTSESEARVKAIEILSQLGLGNRLHHKPSELSGGQQQRVAIARALANDPEVILADEPTGNLDSKTGEFVMEFLEGLNRKEGKTVIIVTHDLNLINYAKRVIYIKDGRIERESLVKRGMKK
jgi:putative ABC transport system ATP-binding protein